ncbi:MAG: hypothetical protein COW71_05870 [Ignavibacteriales bacterium CG18_big_fil_WC_8_21_14_2_50_31_20]|nr:MAG: hypothetical protein COW71_05870 [Ignavibacteriales bacterium CG18_big_fil_WC_8_21_14_2_50_31_20]
MKNENKINWFNDNVDKHALWTIKIANRLKEIYPNCGIGIAGSISLDKHTKNSDVDLLVIDKSFPKNVQCVFFNKDHVETNLLFLNPNLLKERYKAWSIRFNGQHITYIYMAKILYDPKNYLSNLKNDVKNLIDKVQTSNTALIETCTKDLIRYNNNLYSDKTTFSYTINKLTALISLWFIYKGIKNLSKEDDKSSFQTIKKNDIVFYKLLKSVLLNSLVNNTNVEKLSNHMLDKVTNFQ